MSILQANGAGLGGKGDPGGALGSFYGHTIDQSLRFESGDSANLSRNITSAGNRKTFTISVWIKRSKLDGDIIIGRRVDGNNQWLLQFQSGGQLDFYNQTGGSITVRMITNALFRDVSSWYHVVCKVDVTTGTSANAIYVNGVEQSLSTDSSSNADTYVNSTGTHYIGTWQSGGSYDGYMAEFHFIDGTALDPTSFGETINGVWVPKAYDTADGAYGTNGFYLPFDDSSAIGDDESGNTNDFTANNLAASDVVPDSPTNNFATLNSVHPHLNITFKEGNLRHETATNNRGVVGNFLLPKSGKWYWEHWSKQFNYAPNNELHCVGINIPEVDLDASRGGRSTGVSISSYNGAVFNESATGTSYGSGWTENQGVAVLFDADAATISFSENGGAFGSAVSIASGTTNKDWIPFVGMGGGSSTEIGFFNFGQDGTFAGETTSGNYTDANGNGNFKWQPPTDALALCTANLPEPTISPNADEQADDYFNTVLYTGDGTTSHAITGVGFEPNWVWLKQRNSTGANFVYDTIRGATKGLHTNLTDAETTYTDGLLSFDSDGFTLGNRGNHNGNNDTYVSWNWKAGGTAVSNTDGSITSQVSAAPDAGFSICTWTGNGTSGATIGHGLSSAPELIFSKRRDSSGMWTTYAKPAASDAETDYLRLDGTDALADDSRIWNDTVPTASVFSVGSGTSHINTNNATHVTYCFHSVDGYSKVGSYTGNGNADGTFIYTGFRPAWIMMKVAVGGTGNWFILDATRSAFNEADDRLDADNNNAEGTGNSDIDFLSNGIKIRTASTAGINQSGDTHIYLAFAEAPFKYANAR